MGKYTTRNQLNSRKRKDWNQEIGGGLLESDLLRFAGGVVGKYAGKYEIDESRKIVLINYYLDNEVNPKRIRDIPEGVKILGRHYSVESLKVERPVLEKLF